MTHASKTKTITVEYPSYKGVPDMTPYYLVTKAQHSTEYLPDTYLTKDQVDELNDNKQWAVTILPRRCK